MFLKGRIILFISEEKREMLGGWEIFGTTFPKKTRGGKLTTTLMH